MKKTLMILAAALSFAACGSNSQEPAIIAPPAELGLHEFYAKYLDVKGIHLISSEVCSDDAMYAAYKTLTAMTDLLPEEVVKSMGDNGAKVAVMAKTEVTTDIPEHAYLKHDPETDWDQRARGLGGDLHDPTTSCAEENVLCLEGDRYWEEDILVHEFAHAIHSLGISPVYPDFNEELQTALDAALAAGKWVDTYAGSNIYEYWAEGVQSWFNVNKERDPIDGVHNAVNTREELQTYDPVLYEIIARYFPATEQSVSAHKMVNNIIAQ
ncbi:MAG: hypothetical protein IKU33_02360 [Bacteroidales bacterium]|nr:hypothetical protein [Bacteroidales bacterium]